MKKLLIPLIVLFLLFATIIFFFKSTQRNKKENNIQKLSNVKIGYMPFVSNWPLFLAIENNFFEQEGLRVELVKFTSGADAINAVAKGDINSMAVNPLGDLFNIELRTPGLIKIFAMQQSSSNGNYIDTLLVKKGSKIQRIVDLKEKKIGVNPGTAAEAFTKIVLEKNRLLIPQDIEIIKLAPNLQLQALNTGQIDALVSYEPNTTIGLQDNIAQVLVAHPFETIMDPFPNVGFTISYKTVTSNPSLARKIVKTIEKSILYGRLHKEEANRSSIKYTGVTESILNDLHNPEQLTGKEIDKSIVQKVADLYFENNMLPKKINVNDLFYIVDENK